MPRREKLIEYQVEAALRAALASFQYSTRVLDERTLALRKQFKFAAL